MSEIWEYTQPSPTWPCPAGSFPDSPHLLEPSLVTQRMTPGPTHWPRHWYCITCRLVFQNEPIRTQSAVSSEFASGHA
jgi:hypothetical protein